MSKNNKKTSAFLIKTFQMLQKNDFTQIISWNEEGTGFFINDANYFAQKVLPIYFKHNNLHSFIRQLNMYGFNKKRGNKTQNYYHHISFLKGNKQYISYIQRKTQNKVIKQRNQSSQLSIQCQDASENCFLKRNLSKKIQILCQSNKYLLIQQIVNLDIISKDCIQNRENFPVLISEYIQVHNQLLSQLQNLMKQQFKMQDNKQNKLQKEENIETKVTIKDEKQILTKNEYKNIS